METDIFSDESRQCSLTLGITLCLLNCELGVEIACRVSFSPLPTLSPPPSAKLIRRNYEKVEKRTWSRRNVKRPMVHMEHDKQSHGHVNK